MISQLFTFSPHSILPYFLLGFLTLVEGPIASLAGGAALSSDILLPLPVYFSVVLGNLAADLGWYGLGRLGKLGWLTRIAPKVSHYQVQINQLQGRIQQHAARLIFFSKFTVGFPIPTLIATGLSRVPLRRWAAPWVVGELLKSAALLAVGYFFSAALQYTSTSMRYIFWITTTVIVLVVVLSRLKNTV